MAENDFEHCAEMVAMTPVTSLCDEGMEPLAVGMPGKHSAH